MFKKLLVTVLILFPVVCRAQITSESGEGDPIPENSPPYVDNTIVFDNQVCTIQDFIDYSNGTDSSSSVDQVGRFQISCTDKPAEPKVGTPEEPKPALEACPKDEKYPLDKTDPNKEYELEISKEDLDKIIKAQPEEELKKWRPYEYEWAVKYYATWKAMKCKLENGKCDSKDGKKVIKNGTCTNHWVTVKMKLKTVKVKGENGKEIEIKIPILELRDGKYYLKILYGACLYKCKDCQPIAAEPVQKK